MVYSYWLLLHWRKHARCRRAKGLPVCMHVGIGGGSGAVTNAWRVQPLVVGLCRGGRRVGRQGGVGGWFGLFCHSRAFDRFPRKSSVVTTGFSCVVVKARLRSRQRETWWRSYPSLSVFFCVSPLPSLIRPSEILRLFCRFAPPELFFCRLGSLCAGLTLARQPCVFVLHIYILLCFSGFPSNLFAFSMGSGLFFVCGEIGLFDHPHMPFPRPAWRRRRERYVSNRPSEPKNQTIQRTHSFDRAVFARGAKIGVGNWGGGGYTTDWFCFYSC